MEIERRFPPGGTPPKVPPDVIASPRPGVITGLDTERLVETAARADCVLEVCLRMGHHRDRVMPARRRSAGGLRMAVDHRPPVVITGATRGIRRAAAIELNIIPLSRYWAM